MDLRTSLSSNSVLIQLQPEKLRFDRKQYMTPMYVTLSGVNLSV